jgi:hypothetical protein
MKNLIFAFLFLFQFFCFPQSTDEDYKEAYPIIGWDSLSSIIQRPETYPEIGRLAGETAHLYIYLKIDSMGKFVKIEPVIKPNNLTDSLNIKLFFPPIENILKSVKWVPAIKNKKYVDDTIPLLFNFILIDSHKKYFNIIAPIRYIEMVH